jgi:hypothetical protein
MTEWLSGIDLCLDGEAKGVEKEILALMARIAIWPLLSNRTAKC